MKEIGKLLAYLAAIIVLGALLAPPLYWLGQWVAAHGVLPFLQKTEFQRFFNRAVLIAALVLLWPLIHWLRIGAVSELGLHRNPWAAKDLTVGFSIAVFFLLLMSIALVATDAYRLKTPPPWSRVPSLLLTTIVVSVLEEGLFRGALQGLIQRSSGKWLGLNFVAALFAVVHFLKPESHPITNIEWDSGFVLLPHVFSQFSEPLLVANKCLTLFVGGWILGYARLSTSSLWMPIGLHAGWIVAKMGFGKFTKRSGDLSPWFGSDLFAGIGPVVVLLATGLCVLWWLRSNGRSSRNRG